MDPLSISLVRQYLASTNSALADQFKDKYQPQKTSVELKEVLSKWNEEQLARGLIYQHLETVAPSLAVEFRNRHLCSLEPAPKNLIGEIQKKLMAIASTRGIGKVEDGSGGGQEQNGDRIKNTLTVKEQLVRGLIHEHLKKVAPSLAVEFRNRHLCSPETAPRNLMGEIQKSMLAIARTRGIGKDNGSGLEQEQKSRKNRDNTKRYNTFTTEELVRIKKAIANKEDDGKLAKESLLL